MCQKRSQPSKQELSFLRNNKFTKSLRSISAAAGLRMRGQTETAETAEAAAAPPPPPTPTTTTASQIRTSSFEDVHAIDTMLSKAAKVCLFVWIGLVVSFYSYYYRYNPTQLVYLLPHEQYVAERAFWIQLVAVGTQFLQSKTINLGKTKRSGILTAILVVQFISLSTSVLLAWFPNIVVVDHITGSKVYIVRWFEWAPVAGLLTFLSESTDVLKLPKDSGWIIPIGSAILQSASASTGLIFPYCSHYPILWMILMIFACVAFAMLIPRVLLRRRLYLESCNHRDQQSNIAELNDTTEVRRGLLAHDNLLHQDTATFYDSELGELRRFAYYLMGFCLIVWTELIFMYFAHMAINWTFEENHWIRQFCVNNSLNMVTDTFHDVLSKVVYTRMILEVHMAVFCVDGRATRQLTEMRQLMASLWDSSSDVITISVHNPKDNSVSTVFSPSFVKLIYGDGIQDDQKQYQDMSTRDQDEIKQGSFPTHLGNPALVLEIQMNGFNSSGMFLNRQRPRVLSAYFFDALETGFCSDSDTFPINISSTPTVVPIATCDLANHPAVQEAARIVSLSWQCQLSGTNHHNRNVRYDHVSSTIRTSKKKLNSIHRPHAADAAAGNVMMAAQRMSPTATLEIPIRQAFSGQEYCCEVLVSSHWTNTRVAVVRDMTERQKRLEAERRVAAEIIGRQKDAQAANRFTRHEVKNGLLSAIEECHGIKGTLQSIQDTMLEEMEKELFFDAESDFKISTRVSKDDHGFVQLPIVDAPLAAMKELVYVTAPQKVKDLEKRLHEVLETVLTEAIVREVVQEAYEPKLERIDFESFLKSSGPEIGSDRFQLQISQSEIPPLLMDVKLLSYIYRSAIGNALKYGKIGGVVVTKIDYDCITKQFLLEVTNEPGVGHDELFMMEEDVINEVVFSQGSRLPQHMHERTESSGSPLAGKDLSLGDGAWLSQKCAKAMGGTCKIRFTEEGTVFSFRCMNVKHAETQTKPSVLSEFQVPPNTWGIAVDDSKIQRKIIHKVLQHVGVQPSRILSFGSNAANIEEFCTKIPELLSNEKDCLFLVIVDEFLDYSDADSEAPVVLSGSAIIKELLGKMAKQHESRVLALIRSANDADADIKLYNSRAHGFFPKSTMQRSRTCELLDPIWNDRFKNSSSS